MKIKIIILIGVAILLLLPSVNAQVTVGSNVPPRKGTLLDLKENNNTNKDFNSKKGFGLPRVALESLTTLTVDNTIQKDNYVGMTVYNIANNDELSEGTYCWFGTTWKQIVLVDGAGKTGNYLQNNGNNTYSWANITIPQYKFWKPTHSASFISSKAPKQTYNYPDITQNNGVPPSSLFKDKFSYTETVNAKTDAGKNKFILVDIVANINKIVIGNRSAVRSFWEEIKIEVLIDDVVIKEYSRIFSNPEVSVANSTFDLFAMIPLTGFNVGKGDHTIQVRVSNVRNTYSNNTTTSNQNGYFAKTGPLLETVLTNFGFILYEEE
ncbi:MAG: hypothetical protein ACK5KL_03030 [Dysgonomonas sp.]